eukprot:TRINITY_DN4837_c0_g1_i1.p1 TRINITY_DN4837_c0_g1~~TRINITY_DN4837_c0_g1_i1.p1  ORF type:complete len:363 (+),score=60.44 TRINITY_DN4837_c0_g1_i1:607-1695(+)
MFTSTFRLALDQVLSIKQRQFYLSKSLQDSFAPFNNQNLPTPPFMSWVESVFENFQSDNIMRNFDYECKMNMGTFQILPIELIALHLLPYVSDDSAGGLSLTCKGFFCLVRSYHPIYAPIRTLKLTIVSLPTLTSSLLAPRHRALKSLSLGSFINFGQYPNNDIFFFFKTLPKTLELLSIGVASLPDPMPLPTELLYGLKELTLRSTNPSVKILVYFLRLAPNVEVLDTDIEPTVFLLEHIAKEALHLRKLSFRQAKNQMTFYSILIEKETSTLDESDFEVFTDMFEALDLDDSFSTLFLFRRQGNENSDYLFKLIWTPFAWQFSEERKDEFHLLKRLFNAKCTSMKKLKQNCFGRSMHCQR